MRSSTFHKTGLSREKMAALEQMMSDNRTSYDDSPGVYVRNNKDRDLDLLWQVSRVSKNKKMTRKQIITSFVAGILVTLFLTSTFNNLSNNFSDVEFWQKGDVVNVSPADNKAPTVHTELYTVKPGDTIDSIVMRFYGVYDVERIAQIQAINHLKDPSKISLGQTLTIPIN
ncbi:MAG: LysM domain-containing protein [bacterium]